MDKEYVDKKSLFMKKKFQDLDKQKKDLKYRAKKVETVDLGPYVGENDS